MIYIGIDVAKDKHDVAIIDSNGEILEDIFQISNSLAGFEKLLNAIHKHQTSELKSLKIGLEATGHYSNNIQRFLEKHHFSVFVFNPLQTNLVRKSQTLRKTKTDKIDALMIATMLFTPTPHYSSDLQESKELKSLIRYRYRLIGTRSNIKVSITRIIDIVFPEISNFFSSNHTNSCYQLLLKYPSTKEIAKCHLTKLSNLLHMSSKGHFSREKTIKLREAASTSIGLNSYATSFELQQTINTIIYINQQIKEIDAQIKILINSMNTPITTIPGISTTLGSMIIAEIGNIENFKTPGKLLAFAGLEPSTYQSGSFTASRARMVKRGSKYLRWALMNAARMVSIHSPTFSTYCSKKRNEGKHYFVALSHVAKKLVRVIFHLLKNNCAFQE